MSAVIESQPHGADNVSGTNISCSMFYGIIIIWCEWILLKKKVRVIVCLFLVTFCVSNFTKNPFILVLTTLQQLQQTIEMTTTATETTSITITTKARSTGEATNQPTNPFEVTSGEKINKNPQKIESPTKKNGYHWTRF